MNIENTKKVLTTQIFEEEYTVVLGTSILADSQYLSASPLSSIFFHQGYDLSTLNCSFPA